MAAEAVVREPFFRRVVTFYQEVVAEMKRVTWPDATQIRQLSIAVIVLSLLVGGLIAILDLILQSVLVKFIPSVVR
jgi:preprotein translocase subunit SecE